jgi:hypothetical protein
MALRARDEAIYRLNEAYISLRQKNEVIDRLQKDLAAQAQHTTDNSSFHTLPSSTSPAPSQQAILAQAALEAECQKLKLEVARLEVLVIKLNDEIRVLTDKKAAEPLPIIEDNAVSSFTWLILLSGMSAVCRVKMLKQSKLFPPYHRRNQRKLSLLLAYMISKYALCSCPR